MSSFLPTKSFLKKALWIMLPVIFSEIIINLVYFVDNFMASAISPKVVAAVSLANEWLFIFTMTITGVGTMVDILRAQFLGSKNLKLFHKCTKFELYISLFLGTIFLLFITIIPEYLLRVFDLDHQQNEIIDMSAKYMRIMGIGFIVWVAGYFIGSTLNIVGKTHYSLYRSIISLIFNIMFNFIFIYVFDMGIMGLAYSTIMARILEFFILLIFLYMNRAIIWFGWKTKLTFTLFCQILKYWKVLFGAFVLVVGLVLQTLIWTNYYGQLATESMGIVYTLSSLGFACFGSINVVIKIMIGKKLGEGKFDEAVNNSKMLMTIALGMGIIFSIIVIILGVAIPWDQIMFSQEFGTQVGWIIKRFVIIFVSLIPIFMLSSFAFSCLESGGHTLISTIFNTTFHIWCIFPILFLLANFTNISFWQLFLVIQVISSLNLLVSLPFYFSKKWVRNITHFIN